MIIAPRVDELIASLEWPAIAPAPDQLQDGDVLVTCAGFEDRALAFLRRVVEGGSRGFRVVGIDYLPAVPQNRVGDLRDLAMRAGALLSMVTYHRSAPESAAQVLDHFGGARRVLIDVSGMSRLLVVQLVAGTTRAAILDRTVIVYSEASAYPPSREEVEDRIAQDTDLLGVMNFISSGVLGIMVVPELSTVAMQGQPVRLIAFPSFNPTQLATLCAEIYPSFFTIINGIPHHSENAWRRDAIRNLNGVDQILDREERDASTFDYRETLSILLDVYRSHGASQKLVIAPTGSKMQSVAVGLVCGFLRDIQVVYPTPAHFPTPSNYTTGIGATYGLALEVFAKVEPPPLIAEDEGDLQQPDP